MDREYSMYQYWKKTTKQLREIGVRHILESKDTTYVSMFYKIKRINMPEL